VALAARSVRLTSDKYERVKDSAEDSKIKRQAMKVVLKGSLTGLVITALIMLIP